jgi:hypothetical protein
MELINAYCVFQRASGTKRGSFYYVVIGAFQTETSVTYLAYEATFNPTKAELKFENLKLNFNNAKITKYGHHCIFVNPFSEEQQKTVNRAIIGWLRKPSELEPCIDKETGVAKSNFHYKSLGMGKFFILPYGNPMDRMEWEIFCLNIGSEKVRCIMQQKQIM